MLSGGLDSVVATHIAMRDFHIDCAITFDYGQRAATREIEISKKLCHTHKIQLRIIPLPWLADETSTALVRLDKGLPQTTPETVDDNESDLARAVWVPNRNGVFVAVAAAIAEAHHIGTVIAGFNSEEARTFPDNSVQFIDATNMALKFSTINGVFLKAPTAKMNKEEIAMSFVALNIDPSVFWCCYDGGEKLCGSCESCARAIRAFRKTGAWDLIKERFE